MMITLRPATASDQKTIHAIIREARINPFHLHWQRFIVAVDGDEIVGVGQIKPFEDGSRELASIAVVPAYQHRGVASQIIQVLMAKEPGTIHLFCRVGLADFYRRFGFEEISFQELPADLARIHGLGEWVFVILSRLFPKNFAIACMRFTPQTDRQAENPQ